MHAKLYPLVSRRQGTSVALGFFVPIAMTVLLVVLCRDHGLKSADILADKGFVAVLITGIGLFEVYVFVLRYNIMNSELVLHRDRLELVRRGKTLWTVNSDNVRAIRLRRYPLRTSYFSQALVFESSDGSMYLVPTSSSLFGSFPQLPNLLSELKAMMPNSALILPALSDHAAASK